MIESDNDSDRDSLPEESSDNVDGNKSGSEYHESSEDEEKPARRAGTRKIVATTIIDLCSESGEEAMEESDEESVEVRTTSRGGTASSASSWRERKKRRVLDEEDSEEDVPAPRSSPSRINHQRSDNDDEDGGGDGGGGGAAADAAAAQRHEYNDELTRLRQEYASKTLEVDVFRIPFAQLPPEAPAPLVQMYREKIDPLEIALDDLAEKIQLIMLRLETPAPQPTEDEIQAAMAFKDAVIEHLYEQYGLYNESSGRGVRPPTNELEFQPDLEKALSHVRHRHPAEEQRRTSRRFDFEREPAAGQPNTRYVRPKTSSSHLLRKPDFRACGLLSEVEGNTNAHACLEAKYGPLTEGGHTGSAICRGMGQLLGWLSINVEFVFLFVYTDNGSAETIKRRLLNELPRELHATFDRRVIIGVVFEHVTPTPVRGIAPNLERLRVDLRHNHRLQMEAIKSIEGAESDPGDEDRLFIQQMNPVSYDALRQAAHDHLMRFHRKLYRRVNRMLDVWDLIDDCLIAFRGQNGQSRIERKTFLVQINGDVQRGKVSRLGVTPISCCMLP